MRRQKYGSANLKYVKVKREGSGRAARNVKREIVSKTPRVFNLRNVINNNINKIPRVRKVFLLHKCFRMKAIIKIFVI